MKSVSYIYLIVIFFIYLIICSIIYISIKNIYVRYYEKRKSKMYSRHVYLIRRHVESIKVGKNILDKEIKEIKSKLKRKYYREIFNNKIIELNKEKENVEHTKKYLEYLDEYITYTVKRGRKSRGFKKVNIVYFLGEIRLDRNDVNIFLLQSMKTDSLYLKFVALRSIAQIGNVETLIDALTYLKDDNYSVNEKVLIDIMDELSDKKWELQERIIKNIDIFNNHIQCVIISYFKNSRNEKIAQKLMEKLSDSNTNKEVVVGIIKYFSEIKYLGSMEVLIELLNHDEWEIRAMAAKALGKYYSIKTVESLMKSIRDESWYVRLNTAMSLLDLNLGTIFTKYMMNIDDKYSREIFHYALFVKNKISYEEFKKNVDV